MHAHYLKHIPFLLTASRVALGPLLIAGAFNAWNGSILAGVVIAALLSDIFDGILARRWGCATAQLRLFDSLADTVFYLCTAIALWLSQPMLIWNNRNLLIALVMTEVGRNVFECIKFNKPASYHSILAKIWGLVIACAVSMAFLLHHSNILVPAAFILGILSDMEGMIISILLPQWQNDVKTIAAALRLRKRMRNGSYT